MAKKAISVTLSPLSLQYVRAKALKEKRRSVSETLDAIILSVMQEEHVVRTVVGTISAPFEVDTGELDLAVRTWFRSKIGQSTRSRRPKP
jgi:hypothetical protein